ncbi:MAG: SH3 domain-containing protein [Chloroflexi bacterium]|nr:SH3 domain-containing protein [Chloroflexota bacterium]
MPDPRRARRTDNLGEGVGRPVAYHQKGSNRAGRKTPPKRPGAFLVAAVMLSTAALGVLAFLFLSSSVPEISLPGAAAANTATATVTAAAALETATAYPTASSVGTATATPAATAEAGLEVGGTGGRGVYMRAKPSSSAQPVVSLEEGAKVKIIGEDVAADGYTWRNVEDSQGNRGWIVSNFLVKVPTP